MLLFSGRHVFILWGVSGCPCIFVCPCMFVHPIHLYTPGVYTPPICPILFCASVFLEALHVVGGCYGLPFVWEHPPLHHPCLGVSPLQLHPHTQSLIPCALYVSGHLSMLCGHCPSVEGFGVFPHQWGGWGIST